MTDFCEHNSNLLRQESFDSKKVKKAKQKKEIIACDSGFLLMFSLLLVLHAMQYLLILLIRKITRVFDSSAVL